MHPNLLQQASEIAQRLALPIEVIGDKKSVNEEVCTLSNINRHMQDIQYTQLLDEVKSKVIHRVFMSELDQLSQVVERWQSPGKNGGSDNSCPGWCGTH